MENLLQLSKLERSDELPAPESEVPTCIVARTRKGRGLAFMEQAPQAWHLGLLTPDQRDAALREIEARLP